MWKISYLFGSCYQHYYQAATVVSFCPASVSLFLSLFLWCVCWPFCNMIFIVIFYLYYIQSAHCLLCALLWLHCWPRFAGHRIWLASAHNFNKQRLAVSLFPGISLCSTLPRVVELLLHIQFGISVVHSSTRPLSFHLENLLLQKRANFQFKLGLFSAFNGVLEKTNDKLISYRQRRQQRERKS